jgi:hypothetical protein
MTFFIVGIPIRFLNAKILQQNLSFYWTKVLLQGSTDLHPFMSKIMAVMATISPEQLLAIVVNSSLLAKMRRVSKMIAFWKHNYAKKCVDYLTINHSSLGLLHFYNSVTFDGFKEKNSLRTKSSSLKNSKLFFSNLSLMIIF